MPSLSRDLRVFGVDLGALWSALRRPWQDMHDWPVVSSFSPAQPVRVLRADAADACWRGVRARASGSPPSESAAVAVALPESIVLRRTVVLPYAALAEAGQALALQVQALNPFDPADLVWGWRRRVTADGAVEADVALVSRRQIGRHLEGLQSRLDGAAAPEVWFCIDDGPPIVLPGYGETRRERQARRHRMLCGALLAVAVLLVCMLALTPSLQLGLRGLDAARKHGEIVQQARPVLAQREALVQAKEAMGGLSELLHNRIDPLRVLEVLTRELPDGSAVHSFRLQGDAVTISGLTGDAASLMQRLGQQPGLRDVRAPTAATRQPGAVSEAFTIAFQLDPEKFAVQPAARPSAARGPESVGAAPARPSTADGAAPAASAPAQRTTALGAGPAPQPATTASAVRGGA